MKRDNKGFTLMELIIIVSIIGLVVTLGFTNYITSIKRSRDGRRKADLEQVRSALEMRRADCGSYPTGSLSSGGNISCGSVTYITIPNDPVTGRVYSYTGAANSYTLCAALEVGGGTVSGCGSCGVICNYKVTNP